MDTDPQLQYLVRLVPDVELLYSHQQVQGGGGYFPGMADAVPYRQSGHQHVRITDGLHLVHVIIADDGIKQSIEVVQQVNHLKMNRMVCLFRGK